MLKTFTQAEILDIYVSKVKKGADYFNKHSDLDQKYGNFLENNFSHPSYHWKNRDFPRAITLIDFNEWVAKHNIKPSRMCFTSSDDPELNLIQAEEKTLYEYDGNSGDLHSMSLEGKFDFFMFNQTIEHLYNPFLALQNIHEYLIDGGYVFTSVPTINIPHMTPIHFNGYTPMGLAMLFMSCGFEVLEIGQWGNYEYLTKLFSSHSWPGFNQLSSIQNEERNACQCWILCKKI